MASANSCDSNLTIQITTTHKYSYYTRGDYDLKLNIRLLFVFEKNMFHNVMNENANFI